MTPPKRKRHRQVGAGGAPWAGPPPAWVDTILTIAMVTLVGCAPPTLVTYTSYPTPDKNFELATRTVARLHTLAVGQSREEVLERMHADPVAGCVQWDWKKSDQYLRHLGLLPCARSEIIHSPYRTATVESGGVAYEVLFYYTGGTSPEGQITEAQLTPVLIKDGTLVGWGREHPLIKTLLRPTMEIATMEPQTLDAPAQGAAMRALADIYYFAFDTWALSDEVQQSLAERAEFLKQHPETALLIEGHADERGSREYNLVLGERRAQEVHRYLLRLGITNAVRIASYGKERPVCTEPDESCYEKNRRAYLVAQETKGSGRNKGVGSLFQTYVRLHKREAQSAP